MKDIELTILMPCLNEEETIGICIEKAMRFLKKNKIKGEVLISDNGSTDNSIKIAKSLGARVVNALEKGYGSALIEGSKKAYGKYVIMGDSDDSYDFLHLEEFVKKLRKGYDLVIGNRFKGGIEKGAMPFSHRYIGNPILSFIGRLFFHSKIKDFHCGLRGYNREKILSLNLNCSGMEYASEMIVKAELKELKIAEVSTTLKKDGRSKKPHLRTFRDGYRHLSFLLLHAPNWLFLFPSIILFLLGLLGIVFLNSNYFLILIIIALQLFIFSIISKIHLYNQNIIIKLDRLTSKLMKTNTFSYLIIGIFLIIIGIILLICSLIKNDIINLNIVPVFISSILLILGVEIIFSGFLINTINIK